MWDEPLLKHEGLSSCQSVFPLLGTDVKEFCDPMWSPIPCYAYHQQTRRWGPQIRSPIVVPVRLLHVREVQGELFGCMILFLSHHRFPQTIEHTPENSMQLCLMIVLSISLVLYGAILQQELNGTSWLVLLLRPCSNSWFLLCCGVLEYLLTAKVAAAVLHTIPRSWSLLVR